MVFYSVERVFKEIEIEDEDIINAMSDKEKETFRAMTTDEEKFDFLDEIGWELAWNSDDWITKDVDCEDNWIEHGFNTDLMEEI